MVLLHDISTQMKLIITLFLITLTHQSASARIIIARVLSIHDGDTITILPSGETKKAKLRLMGVDTPEIDFNGNSQGLAAEMARDYLKKLLPLDSSIQIELSDKDMDANNRYLGQIFYNGVDLNLEMLKAGWGAVYFIYPYDKTLVVKYSSASQLASDRAFGIFAEQFKAMPLPYIFRQNTKGVPGTNLVANFATKKLYSSEDVETIPHFHRVFFSSEETARAHGFSW